MRMQISESALVLAMAIMAPAVTVAQEVGRDAATWTWDGRVGSTPSSLDANVSLGTMHG